MEEFDIRRSTRIIYNEFNADTCCGEQQLRIKFRYMSSTGSYNSLKCFPSVLIYEHLTKRWRKASFTKKKTARRFGCGGTFGQTQQRVKILGGFI